MDQYLFLAVLGVVGIVSPPSVLVSLAVVGVMLADTHFVPANLIYFARFVPTAILTAKVLFLRLKMRGGEGKARSPMLRAWAPFILMALVSILYSRDPMLSLQRMASALFVFIGFGLGVPVFFRLPKQRLETLKILSLVMGGAVLYSASTYGDAAANLISYDYTRLRGVFNNPNTMGLLAMQTMFLLFHLRATLNGKRAKFIILALAILCAGVVVMSGSRASILGMSVGVLVFTLYSERSQSRRLAGLVIVTSACVCVFYGVALLFPEYLSGVLRSETSSRLVLWQRAWVIAQEAPWFGVGFGASDEVFAIDSLYLRTIDVFVSGAHSSLMRLLVELGYAGCLLAIGAFAISLRRTAARLRKAENPALLAALMAAVAASLVNSLFEGWLFGFGSASTVPFWLFYALLTYQVESLPLRRPQRPSPSLSRRR